MAQDGKRVDVPPAPEGGPAPVEEVGPPVEEVGPRYARPPAPRRPREEPGEGNNPFADVPIQPAEWTLKERRAERRMAAEVHKEVRDDIQKDYSDQVGRKGFSNTEFGEIAGWATVGTIVGMEAANAGIDPIHVASLILTVIAIGIGVHAKRGESEEEKTLREAYNARVDKANGVRDGRLTKEDTRYEKVITEIDAHPIQPAGPGGR